MGPRLPPGFASALSMFLAGPLHGVAHAQLTPLEAFERYERDRELGLRWSRFRNRRRVGSLELLIEGASFPLFKTPATRSPAVGELIPVAFAPQALLECCS